MKGDNDGSIFNHLMAARWLLKAVLSSQHSKLSKSLRDFLIEYYIYTAAVSIISIDCRVGPQLLLAEDFEEHSSTLESSTYIGCLCGCWLELLLLIPSVFNIGRRFLSEEGARRPLGVDDLMNFASVQGKIQSWAPRATVRLETALAGRIFQQAMLVYLYTTLSPLSASESVSSHSSAVKGAVVKGLEYLSELPSTARVNTSLCWPIAVIGSCVESLEQRQYLQNRLEVMFSVLGVGNIRQTALLLEKLWATPNPSPWSICQLMQEHRIWTSFA